MISATWRSANPWLSEILGKPAWRIDTAQARDDQRAAEAIAEMAVSPCFVEAKTSVSELSNAHWLEALGFRLADTNIILARPRKMALCSAAPIGVEIRAARPDDAATVVDIAGRSFQWSRFHQDPAVPAAIADRSRAKWVANFFNGSRGDAMIVAATGRKPIGFLQMLGPNPDLVIDLVGVLPDCRARGIGTAMVQFAEATLPSSQRIVVGTQAANTKSLAFYVKGGFVPVDASYVFHLHGRDRA